MPDSLTLSFCLLGSQMLVASPCAGEIASSGTEANSPVLPAPSEYLGKPFDPVAYRAEFLSQFLTPKLPYGAFTRKFSLWESSNPKGAGWISKDTPQATIGLDDASGDGKKVIHYHAALKNYRYAAFGWNWAGQDERGVELQHNDGIAFSIRITGTRRPQEVFFGITELEPAPVSLREYEPDLMDGSWHRVVLPPTAFKWSRTRQAQNDVRGLTLQTFVWEPADFDVQLDHVEVVQAGDALRPLPSDTAPEKNNNASSWIQEIPGRIECAFYDLGGEGIAYHDTTPVNTLSGVLNSQARHQRPHATPYEWNFRRDEGVDISYTKDWADLNHTNLFDIGPNQLYIGSTEDGEWCRYTVDVKQAGTYSVIAVYGNVKEGEGFSFELKDHPAVICKVPVVTGSMHQWNKAEVGSIEFTEPGRQVLTFRYGRGFNFAFFDFVKK